MSDFTTDYLPNLVEIQHSSFRSFLETGLIEELELFFPLTDYSEKWELQVSADQYRIAPPQYKEQEAKQKRLNYEAKVYVPITVKNVKTEETKEKEIFLFNLPLMTSRGTFIINGTEKVIINQILRSPGLHCQKDRQGKSPVAHLISDDRKEITIRKDVYTEDIENYTLGKVARYRLNKKLKHTEDLNLQLTKDDLQAIFEHLQKVQEGEIPEDDAKHLGNRQLRSVGELLQEQVRSGLRKAKRDLLDSLSNEKTFSTKMSGIDFQALNKTISKFFSSSKLSQFMEQTNPLAELTHKRRITALESKRDLREISSSHYGRLCPIQTPEGQNGGLTNALALYARVNEFGLITTPYFPVDDEGKVLRDRAPNYLTADEEDEYRIATADIPTNKEGKIEAEEVPIRYGQEFTTVPPEEVDYLAVSPLQFASVSTSLIPFLEHNDGTRALMGANMQGQALPLLRPERPLVGTGLEAQLARSSGQLLLSDTHGVIDYIDGSVVRIKDQSGKIIEYPLQKYQPSNQGTYLNQQPLVFRDEAVIPGQVLADASGTEEGEIAIGKNVLVAYMPWEGYNYEDAIVISDRLVQEDVYTSIHVEKYDLNVYSKNEHGKREEITRQLPKVSEEALKQLDKQGIIRVGAWVEAGDLLVGKVSPISTSREDPVNKLLSSIFGDDLDDIIDKSLRVPESVRGRVVHVEVLSREQGDELPNGTEMLVRCYVAQARKIKVGDKLAGRHGNKGIVSRILPQADMPFLPDGRPIDIILNPLGVPSRMNVGQVFECLLGLAAENLNARFQVTPFDEMYGEQKSHDTVEEKLKQAAARPGKEWIYNDQHPQQLEIYDGRTGERFDRPVTVGQAYMLKLSHLADHKIHARSTGPYNRVTQQPVAGKANNGGQRFGDMEVWALEAHGAAHTLQELFTIKSDNMQGRKKARKAIICGQPLPKPSIPEAFNVLMRELEALGFNLSVNKDQNNSNRVSEVKIELASPETIKSWSKFELLNGLILKGEITDSRSYFNNKINSDGLLSEEIFGKLNNQKDRRQRMGYIDLGTPVVHVWYQKTLAVLLEMKETDIKEIIYYNAYVVINRGESYKQLLSYEEKEQQEEQENLEIRTGAEAILRLLQELDLQEEKAKIEEQLQEEENKLNKRLRIINYLISTETSPEWMLFHNIPVLPPELRPVITLEGGTRSSSDLNRLYERIIRLNNRLVKFQEKGVIPEIMLNKEKRELQKAVDALIKNDPKKTSLKDKSGRLLKSLSDIIKGKEGRFRSNLLGKRVDYSGRSIIIIGPNLKIDQCGLPKKMAIELFQPFVIHKLIQQDNNGIHTIEEAKRKLAHPDAEVWKTLEEVVQYHPVLLNRAPTLHRLGIQAFKPILVEGEAIQLHPLVCAGFNADFDGDQMAVHVPLSPEAQAEAWHLMLGNRNLLSPATGEPIVTPSQDMVLGCYYLTAENPQVQPQDQKYANLEDVLRAYEQGYLDIHTDVWVRFEGKVKSSQETNFLDIETQEVSKQYIQTTPGRIIYNQVLTALEAEPKIFCNHLVEKKQLKELIAWAFSHYGSRKCAILIDKIKEIGFRYATQSGISICLKDLQIDPSIKQRLLEEGEEKENQLPVEQRSDQNITKIWEDISEKIKDQINPYFRDNDPLNSIYIMSKSGARGSLSQVRQLVGMRGIMANSQGEEIPLPVKKNFQEGLGVSEYLISSYGTRKGVIDTALNTADSGYLTRRLVTLSQDVVVREEDCGTEQGIELTSLTSLKDGEKVVLIPLQDRLLGRTLAANVIDPQTQEVIAERNQEVDQALAKKIGDKVETVYVRSPLTCETSGGVCQHCYGWSLAHHHQVSQGEAVGVIAAQSASEPTTQMTLRTFHTGGAAEKGGDIVQGLPRLENLLEASESNSPCILAQHSGEVKIEDKGKKVKISIVDADGAIASNQPIKREKCLEEGCHHLEGHHVEIATPLTQGVINPNDLLDVYFQHYLKEHNRYQASLLSFGKVQQFLISEVQKVYQDQKIDVADKHIEVIVSQMTSKVEIEDGGNSNWLAGDLVKLEELKTSQNDSIQYKPVLLGAKKASKNAESFLNAASFEETESILTEAALQQKTDHLQGLKENAMVGNLIPAGTGFDPSY